jgi:hypothetical protein
MMTVSFKKDTINFNVFISFLCPHQSWYFDGSEGHTNLYYSPIGFEFTTFPTYHPIRRFGKYLDTHHSIDPLYVEKIRPFIWSQSSLYEIETHQSDDLSMLAIMHTLPGIVEVTFDNLPASQTVDKATKLDNNTYIESISWLAPWTVNVIHMVNYIELDASFYALKPFVYSIPTGIYRNKSIPLGIFIFKTECAEMYRMFFRMLLNYGIELSLLQSKGNLTDEGKAIQSA